MRKRGEIKIKKPLFNYIGQSWCLPRDFIFALASIKFHISNDAAKYEEKTNDDRAEKISKKKKFEDKTNLKKKETRSFQYIKNSFGVHYVVIEETASN